MPRRKKIEAEADFMISPLPPTVDGGAAVSDPPAKHDPLIPPRKPRRRSASKPDLKKELKKIYAKDDGAPLDMTFFERKSKRGKAGRGVYFLFLLTFLAGISWLGFFFFSPGQRFSEEKIKLTVELPPTISPGSAFTLKINYHNDQRVPLGEAFLTLRYPSAFRVSGVEPAAFNKENTEWNLGSLTKDNPGTISISGQMVGNKDEPMPLRVFLNYKPANFNAEFQKILTQNLSIGTLPLEAGFTGPDELSAGQSGNYEITYKNIGNEDLKNLLIKLSTPSGFKINTATPAAVGAPQKTTETEINNFGPLVFKPNEEFKIKISGAFSTQAQGGGKTFTAELLLKSDDQTYSQSTVSKITELTATTVKLELTANDSTDKQLINFEDKINFDINYENSGQLSLKNATVRLVLETPSVDGKSLLNWNALEDKNNGVIDGKQISDSTRNGILTWTKKEIRSLGELKPGDKGTIRVTLPVKAKKDFNVSRLTNWRVKVYSELLTDGQAAQTLPSNVLDLVLTTDLALAAKTTLKETKNQASTYIVNWMLTNSLHEITDVVLTAALPKNADWGGLVSVSAGELSFDKDVRQATWKINRIPVSFPKTEISFAITLKNSGQPLDAGAIILDQTEVKAKDKVTGEQIIFSKEALTP